MPKQHKIRQRPWNPTERQAFADGKLRAQTIPNKRREASRKACRKSGRQLNSS